MGAAGAEDDERGIGRVRNGGVPEVEFVFGGWETSLANAGEFALEVGVMGETERGKRGKEDEQEESAEEPGPAFFAGAGGELRFGH